ncbi:MAG: trypsin-like peptidase domain-containing protein [Planctomycetota bacterium]
MIHAVAILLIPLIAVGNPIREVVDKASPAVVKLYGAAAGREHGYGTGVIVSADGDVITTLSILVTGRNLRVVTSDGRRFDATLVRTDEARQLALLHIDATGLPFLPPATTDALRPGDTILAMTNCFKIADGDEPVSVSRGILSARLPTMRARRLAQDFEYTGPALVYDAITANPGSAGGPVLDLDGRFIGLVGKVVEATTTNTRINYAIPGEQLAEFLSGTGVSTLGGTGVSPVSGAAAPSIHPTSSTTAPSNQSSQPYVGIRLSELGYRHVSAFVERVRTDSPAAKAGIKQDDLIVAIDGKRVVDAATYQQALASLVVGQTIPFTIKRGEQVLNLPVTLGVQPE